MTNDVMDKVVDNKLLTAAGRIGMAVSLLLLPFLITMLVGFSTSINNVENRVTVIETKQTSNTTITTSAQDTLSAQVEELRKQNIMILQAIARLEAKSEDARRP